MARMQFMDVVVGCVLAAMAAGAHAQAVETVDGVSLDQGRPTAWVYPDQVVAWTALPVVQAPPVDREVVAVEDEERRYAGLPPRYAIPHLVLITPETDGRWEGIGEDTDLWRLRISSPGAASLNLGFGAFRMPEGGSMLIYASDRSRVVRPITADDNTPRGEFWSPVVVADELIVEVTLPAGVRERLVMELTSINVGYRGFGAAGGLRAGTCNNDVVCPEGDPWRDEIPSVGVISLGGGTMCTGFMVNNTAQDETPFFITAQHCGVNSGNASSLVVYWNFESPTCGQQGGGSLNQWQSGSTWRSAHSASDFTLVELNAQPSAAWNITYAGWDRSTADPTSAVAIHHPATDEKSISFEYDPCTTTSYLGNGVPGDGTHIRVIDWDDGTTEPGSSGSPLFDQNHHVVGQLHGGYASCTSQTSDWYGRFSRSWIGGGGNSTRLSNWLDPIGSGAISVDTLVPGATGMRVTPSSGFDSAGNPGGPFSPGSTIYTIQNQGAGSINYTVTKTQPWVSLTNASGGLAGGASVDVTVSINSAANSLGIGSYNDTVTFTNTTDGNGNTTRSVSLQVGAPQLVYSFPMNTNPGWTTTGLWAFGQPTGNGGGWGSAGPDPTSGHTGTNVYGYNLNGNYENNLPERHLTSTAIDCTNLSGVTLRFWRWLGVEVSTYDHAYVRVSNNGSTWTTIWQNGPEVGDFSWTFQEFDISAVADGQPTVYLRWTVGTTDSSWQYCGWNIDDVEIWGLVAAVETCTDGIQNQGEDLIDCGGPCPACECLVPADCSDGAFCTGTEGCDAFGACQAGSYPCSGGQWCDEGGNICVAHGDGDFDGDGGVDLGDFAGFQGCYGAPAGPGCGAGNMTGTDGMIDANDYAVFEAVLTGP